MKTKQARENLINMVKFLKLTTRKTLNPGSIKKLYYQPIWKTCQSKKNRNKKIRIEFDRKEKTKEGWNHKKKNLKIISNKTNNNKKKWDQIWKMKNLKGSEIEKAFEFHKLLKIKNYNKKNMDQIWRIKKIKGVFMNL